VVEGDFKRSTWLACEGIMGNMTLFFAWVVPIVSALLRGSFILANHQIILGRFCLPLVTETTTGVKIAPDVFQ
jgi:hypothetical protein